MRDDLNSLYRRSTLAQSFDRVEVEAFSPGSIIVDYYVVFNELMETIDTQDLKDVVEVETKMPDGSGKNMLGDLQIDPNRYYRITVYIIMIIIRIDFIVVGVESPEPSTGQDDDYMLLPPWAVAVVVIGLASVAFVIIFGVSMVNNFNTLFVYNPHCPS